MRQKCTYKSEKYVGNFKEKRNGMSLNVEYWSIIQHKIFISIIFLKLYFYLAIYSVLHRTDD